jgi:hypothetical protein
MELADKSLDDLLRRLPVIILEDSTLHPDYPFLVWLMMAISKDYQIPYSLMKRVFRIVFETASCPWQDHLPEEDYDSGGGKSVVGEEKPLAVTSFYNDNGNNDHCRLDANSILVWSMLIRSSYGGMAGDIQMLKSYATTWRKRFLISRVVPASIRERLSGGQSKNSVQNMGTTDELKEWSQVPIFIHQKA